MEISIFLEHNAMRKEQICDILQSIIEELQATDDDTLEKNVLMDGSIALGTDYGMAYLGIEETNESEIFN